MASLDVRGLQHVLKRSGGCVLCDFSRRSQAEASASKTLASKQNRSLAPQSIQKDACACAGTIDLSQTARPEPVFCTAARAKLTALPRRGRGVHISFLALLNVSPITYLGPRWERTARRGPGDTTAVNLKSRPSVARARTPRRRRGAQQYWQIALRRARAGRAENRSTPARHGKNA